MRISFLVLALAAFSARAEVDKKTERTWKAKCASCHGADGKGDTEQGAKVGLPDFKSAAWQKATPDAKIKQKIVDGSTKEKGGVKLEMDPYKDKLDEAQIDSLVAYIRTFGG